MQKELRRQKQRDSEMTTLITGILDDHYDPLPMDLWIQDEKSNSAEKLYKAETETMHLLDPNASANDMRTRVRARRLLFGRLPHAQQALYEKKAKDVRVRYSLNRFV